MAWVALLGALSLPLAWAAPPVLPSGCALLKLPADAVPGTDEQRGCFNDWKDEKRLLRHGVPGCCGTPDTFCADKSPVGLDNSLWDGTCVATEMTPAACGAMCWALGSVATDGPYTLAGVESGDQCFCDTAKNPAYPEGNKRAPATECNTPCAGSATETCGGSSRVEIYQISCSSRWGLVFLVALFVGGVSYVGGGSLYNVKTKGMQPGLEALPHPEFWQEIRALVEDGIRYSSARLADFHGTKGTTSSAHRSSYTSLSEAKDPAVSTTTAAAEEDGSDDSLVE